MSADTKDYAFLSVDAASPHVELLRFNRPQSANAINTDMLIELLSYFTGLVHEPGERRCVVVTGNGSAFCAGGDLKERNGMTDAQWSVQHEILERLVLNILDCPIPLIAAVNGAAFGGGCELILAMDFAYAAEGARFALSETRLGIIPGAGGTQTLPRAVGPRRAKEIIFAAAPFSAVEALEWGIVNRVSPGEDLITETLALAERIAANGPMAVRQAKKAIQLGTQMTQRDGMLLSFELYDRLVSTEDRREGVAAFNEKRAPAFRNR